MIDLAALAAKAHNEADLVAMEAALSSLAAAQSVGGEGLDADIAFHVSIPRASKNPLFGRLQAVVATAFRNSSRITNRLKGHAPTLLNTRVSQRPSSNVTRKPRDAMRRMIAEVLILTAANETRPE